MTRIDVEPREGHWVVKGPGGQESRGFHRQRDARAAARRIVQSQGGGEVIVHTYSGQIAERDTVPARTGGWSQRSSRSGRIRNRNGASGASAG